MRAAINCTTLQPHLRRIKGRKEWVWLPPEPTGEDSPFYQLKFDALDQIPNTISLEIYGVKLITDEDIMFDIPVERFHGELKDPLKEEKPHTKIGSVNDIDLFLQRLWWDERGLGISIAQNVDVNNQLNRISTSQVHDVIEAEYLQKGDHFNNWRFPNVIAISKDSVHEAGMEDYGSRGSGREEDLEYISISVKKDFVETAEVIHVKLSNISQQLTGPWTGKIEVRR